MLWQAAAASSSLFPRVRLAPFLDIILNRGCVKWKKGCGVWICLFFFFFVLHRALPLRRAFMWNGSWLFLFWPFISGVCSSVTILTSTQKWRTPGYLLAVLHIKFRVKAFGNPGLWSISEKLLQKFLKHLGSLLAGRCGMWSQRLCALVCHWSLIGFSSPKANGVWLIFISYIAVHKKKSVLSVHLLCIKTR